MRQDDLREASGAVDGTDLVQAVFYDLMRDHLPAGTLQKLVDDTVKYADKRPFQYTNGYLAQHAAFLADKLAKNNFFVNPEDLVKAPA